MKYPVHPIKTMVGFLWKYSSAILLMIFFFGLVAIFSVFFADFGLGESGYNFVGKTKKITLTPEERVTQTFTARAPGLYQLRVVLGKANIHWNESIEFELMDEWCSESLETTTFDRKPRQQGAYTVFSFPPQLGSQDKRYCFAATYHSTEDRKGEKPYLSAIDERDEIFADRILTDQGKNKIYPSQTIFLRPAYTQGSQWGNMRELENRLSQYKPAFLKGHILTLGIGVLFFSAILLVWIARQEDK